MPQEGRVEDGHVVRGADEKPPVLGSEPDDRLEQFVDDADRGRIRTAAFTGDLLDLVDEDQDVVELGDLVEAPAQPARQTVLGSQTCGEQFEKGPAQAAGDRVRERAFTGPGRTEQHHRSRQFHTVLGGQFGMGQWQDQAALDEPFLPVHARDPLPQSPVRQFRPERGEHADLLRSHRPALLEDDHARAGAEAAVVQSGGTGLALGQDRVHRADATGEEPVLQGCDQVAAQPPLPPGRCHADAQDPCPVALHSAHRGADHPLVRRGHHRRVEGLEGRHGVREREERWLFGRAALRIDADHRFEIVLGVVPDTPLRHHQLRVFGRTPIISRCMEYARGRRRP